MPEEPVALFSGTDRKELYQAVSDALSHYQDHVQVIGEPNSYTLTEICQQIEHEHPEMFWFSGWYSIATDNIHPTVFYVAFDTMNDLTAQQWSDMQQDLVNAAKEICAQIPDGASDYEKALFVHDYLIAHTTYSDDGENAGNAYGCLINHAAYCEGYSRAFLLLMNQLGIRAGLTSGTGDNGGAHMWNYLELGGNEYWVDVTWDDTILEGSDSEQLNHYYCFLNDDLMLVTHRIGHKQYYIPTCSSMDMNYFVQNGWYLDRYDCDAACGVIEAQLEQGKEPIELMLDSKQSYENAYRDLFEKNRFWELAALPSDLDHCTLSNCEKPAVLRIDLIHKDPAEESVGEPAEEPADESPAEETP